MRSPGRTGLDYILRTMSATHSPFSRIILTVTSSIGHRLWTQDQSRTDRRSTKFISLYRIGKSWSQRTRYYTPLRRTGSLSLLITLWVYCRPDVSRNTQHCTIHLRRWLLLLTSQDFVSTTEILKLFTLFTVCRLNKGSSVSLLSPSTPVKWMRVVLFVYEGNKLAQTETFTLKR